MSTIVHEYICTLNTEVHEYTGVHEYLSTKVSSIKSYFTQVGLYTEWIKQKMSFPHFCQDGKKGRN